MYSERSDPQQMANLVAAQLDTVCREVVGLKLDEGERLAYLVEAKAAIHETLTSAVESAFKTLEELSQNKRRKLRNTEKKVALIRIQAHLLSENVQPTVLPVQQPQKTLRFDDLPVVKPPIASIWGPPKSPDKSTGAIPKAMSSLNVHAPPFATPTYGGMEPAKNSSLKPTTATEDLQQLKDGIRQAIQDLTVSSSTDQATIEADLQLAADSLGLSFDELTTNMQLEKDVRYSMGLTDKSPEARSLPIEAKIPSSKV